MENVLKFSFVKGNYLTLDAAMYRFIVYTGIWVEGDFILGLYLILSITLHWKTLVM